MNVRSIFLVLVIFLLATPTSQAGEASAIVEDINMPSPTVQFMDFLEPGKRIDLGKSGSLVLGYLHSCLRETITGGVVVIGKKKSKVTGGKVEWLRVECDGGNMQLTTAQAGKSAVTVFRVGSKHKKTKLPKAQVTLYAISPIISLTGKTTKLELQRLDQNEPPLRVTVSGSVIDLAEQKVKLEPGGLYRITADHKKLLFKIDPLAETNSASLLQQLIRL
jgi:hypothetical protein|tara:strand:+ start:47 stop:706 length:660 start_codon:yes stop_codon:yes gene_type:complete